MENVVRGETEGGRVAGEGVQAHKKLYDLWIVIEE